MDQPISPVPGALSAHQQRLQVAPALDGELRSTLFDQILTLQGQAIQPAPEADTSSDFDSDNAGTNSVAADRDAEPETRDEQPDGHESSKQPLVQIPSDQSTLQPAPTVIGTTKVGEESEASDEAGSTKDIVAVESKRTELATEQSGDHSADEEGPVLTTPAEDALDDQDAENGEQFAEAPRSLVRKENTAKEPATPVSADDKTSRETEQNLEPKTEQDIATDKSAVEAEFGDGGSRPNTDTVETNSTAPRAREDTTVGALQKDGEEAVGHSRQAEEVISSKAESREESSPDGQQQREKWYESKTDRDGQPPSNLSPGNHASGERPAANASQPPAELTPLETSTTATVPLAGSTESQVAAQQASSSVTVHNVVTGATAQTISAASGETTATPTTAPSGSVDNKSTASVRSNATATPGGEDTPGLTQQEKVRLVQRVARSFSRLGPSGGQIQLRLHPPQLGALNVQVRLEGQTMTARMTTESAAAREVILEGLPTLRSRLADQGIEISQFQVEVADAGIDLANHGNQNRDAFSSGTQQDRPPTEVRRQTDRETNAEQENSTPLDRSPWLAQDGLDVHA